MIDLSNLGGCVVSKNIYTRKGNLKWCIREESKNQVDNGWVFLSDIDTEEFLSDSSNMVVLAWQTVAEIEPAIIPIFDMPIGTDIELVVENNRKYFVDTNTRQKINMIMKMTVNDAVDKLKKLYEKYGLDNTVFEKLLNETNIEEMKKYIDILYKSKFKEFSVEDKDLILDIYYSCF